MLTNLNWKQTYLPLNFLNTPHLSFVERLGQQNICSLVVFRPKPIDPKLFRIPELTCPLQSPA